MQNNLRKPQKSNNIGCLTAILGTLIVIVCTVVYAIVSSLICNVIMSARFKGEIACALLPIAFTVILISFVLYEIVFICLELSKEKKNDPKSAPLRKLLRIAIPACIGISLLLSIVSANTYTKLDEDRISKVCFAEYKSYSWDGRNDVMRYTLACSPEGQLAYTLTMKDGEKIELFGSANKA